MDPKEIVALITGPIGQMQQQIATLTQIATDSKDIIQVVLKRIDEGDGRMTRLETSDERLTRAVFNGENGQLGLVQRMNQIEQSKAAEEAARQARTQEQERFMSERAQEQKIALANANMAQETRDRRIRLIIYAASVIIPLISTIGAWLMAHFSAPAALAITTATGAG